MRRGRNIITSVILTLTASGSILASVAVPTGVQASGAHVHATVVAAAPNTYYRG
jgi:NAD(P)H-hydrate repair Nnr-like enzyme with NAD(P)H-hydrate epimerase domain